VAHRESRAPNPLAADAIVALGGLGLGAALATAVGSLNGRVLHAPGGVDVAIGRFTGLSGAYLLL
jgi:hypothetical protein